ncbi:MAG: hypothetical protein N2248_00420 [candidate division WOR-3 bacterium]|nr:hypothetical protein [candidate division WOR-3 bacterium]
MPTPQEQAAALKAQIDGAIQPIHHTAAEWETLNPVLKLNEIGIETDTRKIKIGDGKTAWNNLTYSGGVDAHESKDVSTSVHPNAYSHILMATPQTLADGANIDWDLALGGSAKVTLGGNRTLNNPTNAVNGARYYLMVIQDAIGGRTLSYGSAYKFPGGIAPVLSATANAKDIMMFVSDGTNLYLTGFVADVK